MRTSVFSSSSVGSSGGGTTGYPALTGSPAGSDPDAAPRLARHYFDNNRIDFGQLIEDGFRDRGPGVDPSAVPVAGEAAAPTIVVDRRRDAALERFIGRCRKKLRKAKDDVSQAMVLALLVSDTSGRSGTHASDLAWKHARLVNESKHPKTGELLLGDIIGDRKGPPARGKQPPTGAALVPHRALLFKSVADWLGMFGCSLERRASVLGIAEPTGLDVGLGAAAWNIVQVRQTQCVVDLLFDPGALYQENSPKAQEYRRMLGEVETPSITGETGRRREAPSARSDLPGFMPRPPWYAEPWELELRQAERIGRGGFGEVFHGRWAGINVAVKEIKDKTPTDAEVVDFTLEIALLSQLNHPNIVRFWRGCLEIRGGSRSLLMVTEFVKQGGLSRILHGHGGPALPEPLTLPQALSFGLDVARGAHYLHANKILHLDLKSPNVLCALPWTAKLCDFGLAKVRGDHTMVQSTLQGVSPVWAPPEMFDDRAGGLTEKADVYSAAIIFFELLTKRVPFQEVSTNQLPNLKVAGQLPQIPVGVPEDCAALINKCCALRTSSRPAMSGVVTSISEMAVARGLKLQEVKAPAALLDGSIGGSSDQRAREAEEAAARQLVELEGHRSRLRTELSDLQRRIEELGRRGQELAEDATSGLLGGASGASGPPTPQPSLTSEASRHRDDSWCNPFVLEVAGGAKFRCTICSKLFRGLEFARRHVVTKHEAEAKRLAEDAYFDCDVSNEDALPKHKSISTQKDRKTTIGMGGRFSQGLQDAAEEGDVEQIVTLVGLRADPGQQDDGGSGPLLIAARAGHLEAIDALLAVVSHQPDEVSAFLSRANGAGFTCLHAAASEGHCEVVTKLLQFQAAIDTKCARGKTPLMHAAENGHTEVCGRLVSGRADVRIKTSEGETLVHVAARCGDPDLIVKVITWGGDLQAKDKEDWTPLHEAARWFASSVEALCRAKANVKARSRDGETPLHVAMEGYEQAGACMVLLDWQADPSAQDVDGETPLHTASRRGSVEACHALLMAKANPKITDHSGRSPLDLAKHEQIRCVLMSASAAHRASSS